MRRVLILTYFYPPCTLTSAERALGWARHLPKFGYYPVVVTRTWPERVAEGRMEFSAAGTVPRVLQEAGGEVHTVPYRPGVSDRIYARYGPDRWTLLRRAVSLQSRLKEHFWVEATPYRDLMRYADRLIGDQSDLRRAVVTASPFPLFHVAARLRRKHSALRWIADYRDEWTTGGLGVGPPGLRRLLRPLESRSEVDWVSTASLISSVSPEIVDRISARTGRKGLVLENGFEDDLPPRRVRRTPPKAFRITYPGTLYPSQPVEELILGFRELAMRLVGKIRLELVFLGTGYDPIQRSRVLAAAAGDAPGRVVVTERLPRADALRVQASSQVLAMVAHTGHGDIPSSKLYQCIGLRKAVLLCPGDGGVMERTLKASGLGLVAGSRHDVPDLLTPLIERFRRGEPLGLEPDEEMIRSHSREHKASVLASALDSLGDDG